MQKVQRERMAMGLAIIYTAGAAAFAYLIVFAVWEIVRHGKIMRDSEGDK
jgi:hypothetical protein